MPRLVPPLLRRGNVALVLLTLAACHINLVAPYDNQFAKDAVTVQTDFDTLVQTLRNPPNGTNVTYDANKASYNKVNVDLSRLLTQAQTHTNNQSIIDQATKLAGVVREVEATHKREGHLSTDYLDDKQGTVDQQIGILIRTETDKKALN